MVMVPHIAGAPAARRRLNILLVGDSIVAAMLTNAANVFTAAGHSVSSIAVSGHTIQQQTTAWQASSWRGNKLLDALGFQCGVNNIRSNDAASTILGLIDAFRDDVAKFNPWTTIMLGCILPSVMTAAQQGRFVTTNAGIVTRGGFADAATFFDDNSGLHGLRDDKDSGDDLHPNAAGNVDNAGFFLDQAERIH